MKLFMEKLINEYKSLFAAWRQFSHKNIAIDIGKLVATTKVLGRIVQKYLSCFGLLIISRAGLRLNIIHSWTISHSLVAITW